MMQVGREALDSSCLAALAALAAWQLGTMNDDEQLIGWIVQVSWALQIV